MSSSQSAARVLQGNAAEAARPIQWTAAGAPAPVPQHWPPREDPPSGREASELGASLEAAVEQRVAEALAGQAEALTARWQGQVEMAAAAARQEGAREGERRGREQAVAELEPLMARLLRTIDDLSQTRDTFRREAEEDIVRLALGIARRVVHREVTVDGTVLVGVIRAALDKIGARELHRVLVAPADQAAITAGLESLRLARRIDVVADANLERGAVLFETVKGSLDASLETQLDEIERGLIDALDGNRRGA